MPTWEQVGAGTPIPDEAAAKSRKREPFSRVAIPQHRGPVLRDSTKEHTMQAIVINGVEFKRVMPERCVRLTQWGKGQPITCRCTPCAARNQTPEQAKASVDAAHGFA